MMTFFLQQTKQNPVTKARLKLGWLFLAFLILAGVGCQAGNYSYREGTLQQLVSQPLSFNILGLNTCVFDPQYFILHFPMHHFPTYGHYTRETYEKVAKSQFQLLHTVIDYNRSKRLLALFDEQVNDDFYNKTFFQNLTTGRAGDSTYERIDGQVFFVSQLFQQAQRLFSSGFPRYYEQLSLPQKGFLFNFGASLLLYFTGEISKIHKVISEEKFEIVKANLRDASGAIQLKNNDYWLFDVREEELKKEVLSFYQTNFQANKLILIAYGADHDFSNEFAGWPFQSGHKFCLNWIDPVSPALIP